MQPDFVKLEAEYMDAVARQDPAALEAVLAEEFQLVNAFSIGRRFNKADTIRNAQEFFHLKDWRILEMSVTRLAENAAMVLARIEWDAERGPQRWYEEILVTDVWIQEKDRWRMLTRHASGLRKNS